jgi:hypothetical protein
MLRRSPGSDALALLFAAAERDDQAARGGAAALPIAIASVD